MAKWPVGVKAAVAGGLVGAVGAGVFAAVLLMSGQSTGSGVIDYNCDRPGRGTPWLTHFNTRTGPVGPVLGRDELSLWAGFFRSTTTDLYEVALPVVVTEDGIPVSAEDAYRMICRHPQLGGTGLREMTFDEKADLDIGGWWESADATAIPDLYTDGVARSSNEAHIGWEQIRVYWLPPIPESVLTEISDPQAAGPTTTTKPKTTTTTKPATQRWKVSLSGYEVDEMDRYWQITTRVRGAIRFDYDLQGEFVLRKEDGNWVFDTGSITYATVQLSQEYLPQGSWDLDVTPKKPLRCIKCSQIRAGRTLRGTVIGDDVRLYWGGAKPETTVRARIIVSCRPMPDCAKWKYRTFTSEQFFDRLNSRLLRLEEGATSFFVVDSAAGLRKLDYTITLSKLPTG